MKTYCIIGLLFGLMACHSNQSKTIRTIDFGAFKISAPRDWYKIEIKGIDSYVGGLTNQVYTDFRLWDIQWVNHAKRRD